MGLLVVTGIFHSINTFLNFVPLQWVSAEHLSLLWFGWYGMTLSDNQLATGEWLCETVYGNEFVEFKAVFVFHLKSPSNFRFRQKLEFILQNTKKLLNHRLWGKSVAKVRPPAVKTSTYIFSTFLTPAEGTAE